MKKFYCILYETESGREPIIEYILNKVDSEKEQTVLLDMIETLKEHGAKYLTEKNDLITKKLVDDIFEIKIFKHRFSYCYMKGNIVYILHAFRKNKQKTEKKDLKITLKRFKEVKTH